MFLFLTLSSWSLQNNYRKLFIYVFISICIENTLQKNCYYLKYVTYLSFAPPQIISFCLVGFGNWEKRSLFFKFFPLHHTKKAMMNILELSLILRTITLRQWKKQGSLAFFTSGSELVIHLPFPWIMRPGKSGTNTLWRSLSFFLLLIRIFIYIK